MVNAPVVGGLGAPMMVVGLAAMATGAVLGAARGAAQGRRDAEATRRVRWLAWQQLRQHADDLEQQRPAAGRRLAALDRDLARTRTAMGRIEKMGMTAPTM